MAYGKGGKKGGKGGKSSGGKGSGSPVIGFASGDKKNPHSGHKS